MEPGGKFLGLSVANLYIQYTKTIMAIKTITGLAIPKLILIMFHLLNSNNYNVYYLQVVLPIDHCKQKLFTASHFICFKIMLSEF